MPKKEACSDGEIARWSRWIKSNGLFRIVRTIGSLTEGFWKMFEIRVFLFQWKVFRLNIDDRWKTCFNGQKKQFDYRDFSKIISTFCVFRSIKFLMQGVKIKSFAIKLFCVMVGCSNETFLDEIKTFGTETSNYNINLKQH